MLELRGFILQGDNPFWKAVTHVAESDLLHVGAAGLWEGQCLLHIGRNPSLISLWEESTHYSAEKGGFLLPFRCQTNNWHLLFTVNIYSSTSEPLAALRTSAWCTSCTHQAAVSPLRVSSGEGCERIRKNQCTYCSAPERQKNVHHFQRAFLQVSHLDVVPTALSQTPPFVHRHSLSCWRAPHHHTSIHCCNKDDLCPLKKTCCQILITHFQKSTSTTQQC